MQLQSIILFGNYDHRLHMQILLLFMYKILVKVYETPQPLQQEL